MEGIAGKTSVRGREMERKININMGVCVINVPLWQC